jgi:hypothetical protein
VVLFDPPLPLPGYGLYISLHDSFSKLNMPLLRNSVRQKWNRITINMPPLRGFEVVLLSKRIVNPGRGVIFIVKISILIAKTPAGLPAAAGRVTYTIADIPQK